MGVDAEKIAAVFEFENSPLFNDAQRTVLRVAWHGALRPDAVMGEDFEALKSHFSDREIVAVFSLYGFLNRCNGKLTAELEPPPAAFCGLAARVDPC